MRRATTESRLQIDIREVMRGIKKSIDGKVLIRWKSQRADMPVATLVTIASSKTLSIRHVAGALPNELVDIAYSRCHLGGQRAWFVCNRIGCCRKVAVLYDTPKGFRCRHCVGLVYQSTRERSYDRLLRRARAARKKAGGENNLIKPFPDRPKGMHETTYQRLLEQEAACWGAIGEQARKRLGKRIPT
jgi:hypothetical protein